eukprot:CAMPEP_0183581484 /NCGR_PEP_ID=MMETSP0371-20130417/147757_1 /TAXON_ID=268820 /ORGANISM="Peridinium aciculiferum, Strain PAER-2" /LENGTH=228 /DNA_ID=CAMNT_0025792161 /DNA_START=1 /DNA_END=688 /DNA_ORIENTATION=-
MERWGVGAAAQQLQFHREWKGVRCALRHVEHGEDGPASGAGAYLVAERQLRPRRQRHPRPRAALLVLAARPAHSDDDHAAAPGGEIGRLARQPAAALGVDDAVRVAGAAVAEVAAAPAAAGMRFDCAPEAAGPAASEPNLMLTSSSAGRTATISRKAPGATVNWSATELTMQRHSFNAMVKRQTFDAPQSIQLTMTMGRKAEYGKNYVPNPIAARQLAGTLAMPKSQK